MARVATQLMIIKAEDRRLESGIIRYDNEVTEIDRLAVISGLRSALIPSGLSQAEFARALGTSASRLSTYLTGRTVPSASWYLRAVRVGRALEIAQLRSWITPIDAAEAVRRALVENDSVWALRLILQCRDDLRAALADHGGSAEMSAAWEAAPPAIGAAQWDRLLAAIIGFEFEGRGLTPPAWTRLPAGEQESVFGSPFFTDLEVRAATPPWLAERGIFIAARDLVTA